MRALLRRLAVVFVFVVLSFAGSAWAQSTGGSFGGGSFGGGGGGGGSGGSGGYGGGRGGWSHVGSQPRPGTNFGTGDPTSDLVSAVILLLVAGGILGGIWRMSTRTVGLQNDIIEHRPVAPSHSDVAAISLAIDWRAREGLQKKLKSLTKRGDTASNVGLATMLHETVIELRRAKLSWLYAGAVSTPPMAHHDAEKLFREVAAAMRARFQYEVVRSGSGHLTEEKAPVLKAREAEGKGVVVVTLVVAARTEIPDVRQATNADELMKVLRLLGSLPPSDLVALEVIWSPAKEDDRMSTAELEALYPELKLIREDTVAGRVFCGYCSGPFAAELERCPHCGGPASDATKRS